jgi:hypothetical protein
MNKIFVVGFACLSAVAVAQSAGSAQQSSAQPTAKTHEVKAPRDLATGQASGRAMSGKTEEQTSHSDADARDAATGKASGRTVSANDFHHNAKQANGTAEVKNVSVGDVNQDGSADRVAPSDVNGDGTADKAASPTQGKPSNSAVNTSHSNIKNPREASTGMPTGKRQHNPVTFQKEIDPPSKK